MDTCPLSLMLQQQTCGKGGEGQHAHRREQAAAGSGGGGSGGGGAHLRMTSSCALLLLLLLARAAMARRRWAGRAAVLRKAPRAAARGSAANMSTSRCCTNAGEREACGWRSCGGALAAGCSSSAGAC